MTADTAFDARIAATPDALAALADAALKEHAARQATRGAVVICRTRARSLYDNGQVVAALEAEKCAFAIEATLAVSPIADK